eukprot:TRINITY_DN5410_c0_g2_i1.p1 TRINITY_DN5410_c0_g2~~TRINITY_DN5410_c0_g2_i1.p1  ORF type:complete len:347 (-),score=37.14 TRINITY_DN5410_c0_g2_i1:369-1343(-)
MAEAFAASSWSEDLVRLQAEVDTMRARLDVLSPLLPSANGAREYVQSVECEATVQIARLQGARMPSTRKMFAGGVMDAFAGRLETTRWLQLVTEVLLELHEAQRVDAAKLPEQEQQLPVENAAVSTPSLPVFGCHVEEAPARHPATTPQNATPRAVPSVVRTDQQALVSADTRRSPSPRGVSESNRARINSQSFDVGPVVHEVSPRAHERNNGVEGESYGKGALGHLGVDIRLGKGSWATAYRQAQGWRKEALQLLCGSGIVTARELSDDLTVISDEHIDECVIIARDMLQAAPFEFWAQQPSEAKKCFEDRLTSLYKQRHPSF